MSKRIVPLTDDQFNRLWKDHCRETYVGRVLGQAIIEISEQLAEMEQTKWETVRLLAQTETTEDLVIDWLNRCIVVKAKESDSDN